MDAANRTAREVGAPARARALSEDSPAARGPAAAAGTPLERWAALELSGGGGVARGLICCARCWNLWVRARLLEHLRGERYWRELDRGDFGRLRTELHPDRRLVAEIVARIAAGGENLAVIGWALEVGRPVDDVIAILIVLDVNARRVPRFAWLPAEGACAPAATGCSGPRREL